MYVVDRQAKIIELEELKTRCDDLTFFIRKKFVGTQYLNQLKVQKQIEFVDAA